MPFWDNARFLCVTLVVVGHGIQRLTADSDNALIVYLFIYAFHMPAFAIISGYFSRPGSPNARQMTRVITDIIVPYVIMESIWTLVQFLVEGKREFNPTQPSWTLWFLLALGIFRLVLPYLALLKYPLLIAVILSVGVGYLGNVDSTFSLSRAIGILPFFVLGWKLNEWGVVDRWRRVANGWWMRVLAVAVLGAWLAVVGGNINLWRAIDLRFWFFYDDSYSGLGEGEWWAGAVRLALIALAVLLTGAVFALIPRRETWITAFGTSTMYVYLLHSFILYPLRETGILKDEHTSAVWLLSVVFACVAISIALSAPIVRRVFRPIIEPKPRWLFADQTAFRTPPEGPPRETRTGPTARREP
ncbi:acyltransferase family protein [Conyzicola nivalis]|uniref:Membrane-bound acyltransferase YkrP n=1 Tax=Conyzicola nivalis TaxID=1477021 RepID=A0A916SDI7_9MICO|nr:putative membrane-bound acyltransferase YkrP [Conyzicola nivalis]